MEIKTMERYLLVSLILNEKVVLTKRRDLCLIGSPSNDFRKWSESGFTIPPQTSNGVPIVTHDEFIIGHNMLNDFKYETLEDLETVFPLETIGKSYVSVKVQVEIFACDGENDPVSIIIDTLPHRIWTRCERLLNETTDGYRHVIPVTDTPIMIEYERFPECFKPIGDDPIRVWLFTDINNMSGTQIDYCAEIKITDRINWGFNGVNAVLLFRNKCDEYTQVMTKPNGKIGGEYVKINYHPHIGYWFGTLSLETVQKYFNIEGN